MKRTALTSAQAVLSLGALVAGMIFAITMAPANARADVTKTFSTHAAGSTKTVDHSAWTTLLSTYVSTDETGLNRVDYKGIKAKAVSTLADYIRTLEAVNPAQLDRNEQFAYWANLYNAKTIDIIVAHYPVGSIRDISLDTNLFSVLKKAVGAGGPWKTKVLTVSGTKLSLDDIEHQILRPIFKDPRVHYAVNCASIGCPNLGVEAFTGAQLNEQLDAAARAYVNNPRGISVTDGKVSASSIYSWFQSDFGGSATGVLDHARRYAAPDLKAQLEGQTEISSFDYNWGLNDATTP